MKIDFSALTYENCALYLKMTKYLSEKHLRKSDYNRVCEDIFLMISDAQARGETTDSLFPNGMQEFCDEVAASCPKEAWFVALLDMLFWAFAVLCAVIIVEVLFIKAWADDGEWVAGMILRIELSGLLEGILAAIMGMVISILSSKFAFKKFIFNKKPGYYFYVLLTVAVTIVIAVVLGSTVKNEQITFNWVAVAASSGGAAILLRAAKFLTERLSTKSK